MKHEFLNLGPSAVMTLVHNLTMSVKHMAEMVIFNSLPLFTTTQWGEAH